MDPHGNAEDTEDNVGVPSDVDEGRRDEVTKSKIEGPVCRGGKSCSFSANAVGEDFRRVDPRDLKHIISHRFADKEPSAIRTGPQVGAYDATKRYEQAMTALEAAPVTSVEASGVLPPTPPGPG